MDANHSNAMLIETKGESLYDRALYVSSGPDIETSDSMNFSKPLYQGKILMQFHMDGSSFLAIGPEERKRIAKWLLEGLE